MGGEKTRETPTEAPSESRKAKNKATNYSSLHPVPQSESIGLATLILNLTNPGRMPWPEASGSPPSKGSSASTAQTLHQPHGVGHAAEPCMKRLLRSQFKESLEALLHGARHRNMAAATNGLRGPHAATVDGLLRLPQASLGRRVERARMPLHGWIDLDRQIDR